MKAVKYEFESLFATPNSEKETEAPLAPTFSEDELNAARQAAYAEGLDTGRAEVRAEIAAVAAEAAQQIAASVQGMVAQQEDSLTRVQEDAVRVAHAVARTLAPALVAREPLAEIEGLVNECLATCYAEPRLVVRVAENLVDPVKEITDRLQHEQGFGGQIIILGDERLAGDHCRVEWADGGAERDPAALRAEVDRLVDRYLNSPAQQPPETASGTESGPKSGPEAEPESATAGAEQPNVNGSEDTDVE